MQTILSEIASCFIVTVSLTESDAEMQLAISATANYYKKKNLNLSKSKIVKVWMYERTKNHV